MVFKDGRIMYYSREVLMLLWKLFFKIHGVRTQNTIKMKVNAVTTLDLKTWFNLF
jgi:hypothetical protein